ncbi:MAG: hypothetical protein KF836_13505 [Fimbriimonadaceae bacterium]|nr:hypothetical protein [Fimbriimonadaceae bacterium]
MSNQTEPFQVAVYKSIVSRAMSERKFTRFSSYAGSFGVVILGIFMQGSPYFIVVMLAYLMPWAIVILYNEKWGTQKRVAKLDQEARIFANDDQTRREIIIARLPSLKFGISNLTGVPTVQALFKEMSEENARKLFDEIDSIAKVLLTGGLFENRTSR